MRAARVEDFLSAMNSLNRHDLKIFMLKSLDILEHGDTYDRHFGEFRHQFLESCRRVCTASPSSRLARLIHRLFADSRASGLLEEPAGASESPPEAPTGGAAAQSA